MTGTADEVVALLAARDQSIATAESLTGGLVCAALTSVPGASAVVRGSVVAYAVSVKAAVLGVPQELLDRVGAVSDECAAAMALGGAGVLGADWCIATTGVAGPDPSEGKPVGTVHVAVADREHQVARRALTLRGTRDQIRRDTVEAALRLLRDTLRASSSDVEGTVVDDPIGRSETSPTHTTSPTEEG